METTSKPSSRTVESLGKLTYETKPNTSNLAAGMIIAALLVGGGITVFVYVMRDMFVAGGNRPETLSDWLGAILFAAVGIGLAVGGVFLFRWAKSMFGFRLYIHHEGFWFTRGGRNVVFAWDEIAQVHEAILHERLPLAKGMARRAMPAKTSRSYRVVRCDGLEFGFNENVIPRTSLLAGPLSSAAKDRGIPWESTEETA